MQALQLGEAADFPFLDPPQRRHLRAAQQALFELGAVDSAGALTGIGRQLARFPLDPALGRMLIEADHTGALREVLIITAALTVPDVRERPLDAREHADQVHRQFADARSDFLTLLNIYRAFEQEARHRSQAKLRLWCREHFLSYLRLREWRDIAGQLTELANGMGLRGSSLDADYDAIHRALLAGLLGRIARAPGRPARRIPARAPVPRPGGRARHAAVGISRLGAGQKTAALADGRRAGGDRSPVCAHRGRHRAALGGGRRRAFAAPRLQRAALGRRQPAPGRLRAGDAVWPDAGQPTARCLRRRSIRSTRGPSSFARA